MAKILPEYKEMFTASEAKRRTKQAMTDFIRLELEDLFSRIEMAANEGLYSIALDSDIGISEQARKFLSDMGYEVRLEDADYGFDVYISWMNAKEENEDED